MTLSLYFLIHHDTLDFVKEKKNGLFLNENEKWINFLFQMKKLVFVSSVTSHFNFTGFPAHEIAVYSLFFLPCRNSWSENYGSRQYCKIFSPEELCILTNDCCHSFQGKSCSIKCSSSIQSMCWYCLMYSACVDIVWCTVSCNEWLWWCVDDCVDVICRKTATVTTYQRSYEHQFAMQHTASTYQLPVLDT